MANHISTMSMSQKSCRFNLRADTIVPEQGIDGRFTPTKGDVEFHGIAGATLFQDMLAEGAASRGIEDALFLEQGKGIGGQDLGPFVAVVARRVTAGKDVGKAMGEAVEGRRFEGGDLITDLVQDLGDASAASRVVFQVDAEVEEGEFELAGHLNGGLEVLGGPHALEEILRDRRSGFDMAGNQVQRFTLPAPVFEKLAR